MTYTMLRDGRKEHIKMLTLMELRMGAGGQALGLEQAGFAHEALVEIDSHRFNTPRRTRPEWKLTERVRAHECQEQT